MSKLVEGFGLVLDVFKDLVSLAKKLPESMRPRGLDDFIAGVERLKKGTGDVSKGLDAWGRKQIDNLLGEKSAERVRKWFDNLGKKPPPIEPKPVALAPSAEPVKLANAIEAGTKEAFEVTLRTRGFDVGDREKVAKDQLKAQQEGNKIAEKQDEKLGAWRRHGKARSNVSPPPASSPPRTSPPSGGTSHRRRRGSEPEPAGPP